MVLLDIGVQKACSLAPRRKMTLVINNKGDQRDNTVDREFALHVADLILIRDNIPGPLSMARGDPCVQTLE